MSWCSDGEDIEREPYNRGKLPLMQFKSMVQGEINEGTKLQGLKVRRKGGRKEADMERMENGKWKRTGIR